MKDKYSKLIKIAESFNADTEIAGDMLIIHYPVLGQGSIISEKIHDLMDGADYRVKMIPSDCKLEITVY